ncbi:hypothetical protein [Vibrio sp. 10N.261.46.A3]|uniref:hypothetical protein n=1 Tax=Vibrio sp. 10N.261.46.A3 TaxID=3229658 RepID=UPI00354E4C83
MEIKETQNRDGSSSITFPNGASATRDKNGNISMNIPKISRVDLENITSLKSYDLTQEGTVISHKIEFNNGGTTNICYDSKSGALIDFSGNNISWTISKENVITLRENKE